MWSIIESTDRKYLPIDAQVLRRYPIMNIIGEMIEIVASDRKGPNAIVVRFDHNDINVEITIAAIGSDSERCNSFNMIYGNDIIICLIQSEVSSTIAISRNTLVDSTTAICKRAKDMLIEKVN